MCRARPRCTPRDIQTPSDVEIVNPDLYLCTLADERPPADGAHVERGKGYVPADRNKREGQPIGVIPIDSIFSPVLKANFTVEKTRVGQSTDYDRLLLEIWTDGTVTAEEAVSAAAQLFTEHLQLFARFGDSIQEHEQAAGAEQAGSGRVGEIPVEELDLSVRAFNCLKANEITDSPAAALRRGRRSCSRSATSVASRSTRSRRSWSRRASSGRRDGHGLPVHAPPEERPQASTATPTHARR